MIWTSSHKVDKKKTFSMNSAFPGKFSLSLKLRALPCFDLLYRILTKHALPHLYHLDL